MIMLEEKIKNHYWKQWTPLYGHYLGHRDHDKDARLMKQSDIVNFVNGFYHGVLTFLILYYSFIKPTLH